MSTRTMAAGACAAALCASLAVAQNPCAYDPNIGTPLGLTDDSIASGLALGFSFNFPDGTATTSIDVDSNGRVLLPGSDTSDFTETVSELLAEASSICPYWDDLNPNGTNADDVYFNALPGKALITWKDMVTYGGSSPFTFQCILWADGRVTFTYDYRMPTANDGIVGLSVGNGAADPGPVDYSNRPFPSSALTVYEQFSTFDLPDEAVEFLPGGVNWIVITPSGCASAAAFGDGCGAGYPASFYEIFDGSTTINDLANSPGLTANFLGNGYAVIPGASAIVAPSGSPLSLRDDETVQVTLPWSMPTQIGSITDVWLCTNGWVSFQSTTTTDLSESVSDLLSGPTRIACIWDDLNPAAGGGIYAEQDPTNANLFHITWDQVPEYSLGSGTGANTCQLTLDAGGGWQLKFGAMTLADGMTGYSLGGGVADPGPSDLTAIPGAIVVGDGRPDLSLLPLTRPVIGRQATTETMGIPTGAIAGTQIYGVVAIPAPGIDLTPFGAPGCTLYVSGVGAVAFAVANPTAQHTLGIPNNSALAGAHVYSQSVVLATGVNALGAITSNAVDWTLGVQ